MDWTIVLALVPAALTAAGTWVAAISYAFHRDRDTFYRRWQEALAVIEIQEEEKGRMEDDIRALAIAADKAKDGLDPHQIECLKIAELGEHELDKWLLSEAIARELLPAQMVAELPPGSWEPPLR